MNAEVKFVWTNGTTLAFLAVLGSIPIHAAVIAQLWHWFLVPHGLPALTASQAYGIRILTSFVCHPYVATDVGKTLRALPTTAIGLWGASGIALALGWALHSFGCWQ